MGIFSSSWLRKVWKEYDVRFTIMLSLVLQVVLIILGNRRKYDYNVWIKFFVWCAYLAADSVATVSLGVLSNNLGYFSGGEAEVLDATTQLTAFWAPFLLLHLGGPDAVTAYAIEDNELWLRHLLQVFVQTGVSVYVIYMAWTGSHLSFLSLLMLLAGLIKYGERTWSLRSASSEQLRQSSLKHQTVGREFQKFYRDFKIMVSEGYIVEKKTSEEIVNQQVPPEVDTQPPKPLVQAYKLLDLTKRLFLDSTLTVSEKQETHSIFKQLSFKRAFQVIEIELGLIYDFMYTKAPLLYTSLGLCLRLITFFLTLITLLLFTFLVEKHSFTKSDLLITFFLLVVGIFLEIYAALMLISSDRFAVWLYKQNKDPILEAIKSLPVGSKRWSNKMPQYSLIKFSLKEKPMPCRNLFSLLNIEFKFEKWWSMSHIEVSEDLKKLIFRYFKRKAVRIEEKSKVFFKILPAAKEVAYEDLEKDDPSINEDLGQSILFWHIVTEVWYQLDRGMSETKHEFFAIRVHCKLIKGISRYMLYLLVVHPAMVSTGVAQTSFQDISAVVRDIASLARGDQSKGNKGGRLRDIDKTATCKRLVELHFFEFQGVLGEALKHIQKMTHEERDLAEKWNKIGCIWLEILASAARKCKGREHAQQLRSGGEFLTHVWLLMAYFSFTDHFRQPLNEEIVMLTAK